MMNGVRSHIKEQWIKKAIAAFLIIVLFIALFPAVKASAAENHDQVVKIGYYFDSDYYYKDNNGNYCGYDVEYFYEISKYTNWQYQYVDFSSFEDAYAALQAGENVCYSSIWRDEV
jgi:hypothetical protein